MPERLQKYMARAGVASRRRCETMIEEGRVQVDGKTVTTLGTVVDAETQHVSVDGKPLSLERKVCLVLNKPVSYVTTVDDPEGRRTVMDLIDTVQERVYPVGRLDYDTAGLLLLTNDGDLTYKLLHPKHQMPKVYRVTVLEMPSAEALKRLEQGIDLEDGRTSPAMVQVLRHHPKESVLELTIHEGRNRQVRRMMEAIGHPVKRLKRIRFGPITLDGLASGKWRYLRPDELKRIYASVELEQPASTSTGRSASGKPRTGRPTSGRTSTDKSPKSRSSQQSSATSKRGKEARVRPEAATGVRSGDHRNRSGARPGDKPGSRPGKTGGARPGNKPGSRPGKTGGARPGNKPGSRPEKTGGSRPGNKPGSGPGKTGGRSGSR